MVWYVKVYGIIKIVVEILKIKIVVAIVFRGH